MSLYSEASRKLRNFTTKGSPNDRKRKKANIFKFIEFAQKRGVHHLNELGARHVVSYWKHLRHTESLADKTLGDHRRAIMALWEKLDRPEDGVPKPWTRAETAVRDARISELSDAASHSRGLNKKRAPRAGRHRSQGIAPQSLGVNAGQQIAQSQLELRNQIAVIEKFLRDDANARRIDELGQQFRGCRKAILVLAQRIDRVLSV